METIRTVPVGVKLALATMSRVLDACAAARCAEFASRPMCSFLHFAHYS